MESSTTASTPDLLVVVLLLLEHLSALSLVLLDSELGITHCNSRHPSETVLGLELLHVLNGVVDEGETRGAATTQSSTQRGRQITEGNLESEEDDALIVSHVVLLGQDALKLVLGHGSALGMDNLNRLPRQSEKPQTTI